jgi:hypothetical protein
VGSLNRRLDALERRGHSSGTYHTPEQERRERWFAQARIRRREVLAEPDASHARDLIRLFRMQGFLSGMDYDGLVNRILAWRPEPEGGRSRSTVEREVALAIHQSEPGTEHMVCPSAWRESLAAADELRRRYEAAPAEELAEAHAELRRCEEESDEEGIERGERYLWEELLGAGGLLEQIAGPDEVCEEEGSRRIVESLADAVFGEKGYEIAQHIRNTKSKEGKR